YSPQADLDDDGVQNDSAKSFFNANSGTANATEYSLSLSDFAARFAGAKITIAGLTWDPAGDKTGSGGTGTWNTGNVNWLNSASDVPWDSSSATFGGTGGTVTVGSNVSTGGLTFNVPGYTLSGTGSITLTGSATIDESGGQTVINSAIAGASGVT